MVNRSVEPLSCLFSICQIKEHEVKYSIKDCFIEMIFSMQVYKQITLSHSVWSTDSKYLYLKITLERHLLELKIHFTTGPIMTTCDFLSTFL